MASGTDWLKLIGQVLGVAGGLTGLVAFFLRYANPADKVERWVDEDPEYRSELAKELKGGRFGGLYRQTLDRGLDWLDRRFGPADSARALGICIIIALYYAYAAFFLAWGVGGPGDIGGVSLLPQNTDWPRRLSFTLILMAILPIVFLFGRWLGRQERQLKLRRRRRRRWRRRKSDLAYRAILLVLILLAFALAWFFGAADLVVGVFLVGGWAVVGPAAGALAVRRLRSRLLHAVASAAAGAVAGAVVLAGAGAAAGYGPLAPAGTSGIAASAVAVAVALSGALAGAGAVAAAGAGAGLVLLVTVVAIGTVVGEAVVGVVALTGAVAIAATAAAVIGAFIGTSRRKGAFAGGIGGLAGGVILLLFTDPRAPVEAFLVTVIVLFLILPLVNGLWDWLSWWVSRRLGRDLLTKLQPAGSPGHRCMTITWHALADLVAAIFLLAAMAYLLALGFAGYNQIAIGLGDGSIGAFNLEPFIERAAEAPWTNGLWLTVMLISTLVPTFLHTIMLLASPIALTAIPTQKRLEVAADLETYADQPERRATIRRRAGQYVAREKHSALALATFLLVLLLATLGWLARLIHQGGLADYVLEVARAGIWTAEWVAALF